MMKSNEAYKKIYRKNHPFQIVDSTFVPFILACFVYMFVQGFVLWLHTSTSTSLITFNIGFIGIVVSAWHWLEKIRYEITYILFVYNKSYEKNILMGFALFLLSETFLFISFFWAFFHSSLNPSIFIGAQWPPVGIQPIDPWSIPFLNTIILISSGINLNAYYYSFKALSVSPKIFPGVVFKLNNYNFFLNLIQSENNEEYKINSLGNFFFVEAMRLTFIKPIRLMQSLWKNIYIHLVLTIILGILFFFLQLHEYTELLPFAMSDGIYGSVFYLITGMHGIHVCIGFYILTYNYGSIACGSYTYTPDKVKVCNSRYPECVDAGIIIGVWYWHFVDVIWLFVFIFVYIWGN